MFIKDMLRSFIANILGTAFIIWISYRNYPTLYAVSTESSFTILLGGGLICVT